MSNILNFFGSTNGALGPVRATWDPILETGDTGDNILLGDTQGTSVAYSVMKSPLTSDQDGSEPFNQVVSGISLTITINLVKTSFDILAAIIQGFEVYGSASDEGVTIAGSIGEDDLSIAKPMELIRILDGVPSTDDDNALIVPLAAPTGEVEWSFDATTQRVAAVNIRCYKSDTYVHATTGVGLYGFTRSALELGHVTVSS